MPILMKISEYAKFRHVTARQVRDWIQKGAIEVKRLAPRTCVRVVVSDAELHDVTRTHREVRGDPDIE